jgi:hypothetical protein
MPLGGQRLAHDVAHLTPSGRSINGPGSARRRRRSEISIASTAGETDA